MLQTQFVETAADKRHKARWKRLRLEAKEAGLSVPAMLFVGGGLLKAINVVAQQVVDIERRVSVDVEQSGIDGIGDQFNHLS